MPHIIEHAPTGRAKCRGCDQAITKGDLRFGERLPNPFSDNDGEMTRWFHLRCAAFKRPEPLLETLAETSESIDGRDRLEQDAKAGIEHRRLPRVDSASRAPSGRAACRSCKEPIPKDAWRIALVFYEDGRFAPSGYIHLTCVPGYLETTDILGRLRHFTPQLTDADAADIQRTLDGLV
jgi:hypothetical protein